LHRHPLFILFYDAALLSRAFDRSPRIAAPDCGDLAAVVRRCWCAWRKRAAIAEKFRRRGCCASGNLIPLDLELLPHGISRALASARKQTSRDKNRGAE